MKKLLSFSACLAMVAGVILIIGGLWGISFTHKNITQEKIVTASDSAIPNVPLGGPRTLKAQADVIRKHVLEATGGLTYAEMPQKIAELDAKGNPVLDDKGQPVMVANAARDLSVTATTLTTALNLGIFAYVFSTLVILLGLISIWTGVVFRSLSKKY